MKYLVLFALIALTTARFHRQDANSAVKSAFQGDEPQGNYWWPVDAAGTYSVCAARCQALGFRVAELKAGPGFQNRVLEQYCCHTRGTERVVNLGGNHPELQGWNGAEDEPTFGQLDQQSRVCPSFQRTVQAADVSKFGYAWFNQRVVSCPWTGGV